MLQRSTSTADATKLSGVLLVEVTDAAGRPGTAVEVGGVWLVIDPSDGRLLEWWSYGLSETGQPTEGAPRETHLEQGPSAAAPTPAAAAHPDTP